MHWLLVPRMPSIHTTRFVDTLGNLMDYVCMLNCKVANLDAL